MNKIELRNVRLDGVQQNADGSLLVSGYVNETNTWSETLGTKNKFVEKIVPGAFERALERAKNIDFLYEHDDKQILADTKSGTLTLKEDERGLYMQATIVPTTWGKDAFELIKSGVIKNMSFGFRKIKDQIVKGANGIYERVVHELELGEVSAVRRPAYARSSIQARSIEIVENIEIRKEMADMNLTELKNELREVIKEGKTLMSEKRSLNEFEEADRQDLLKRKSQLETKIEILEHAEQRNIIEIAESKTEEISAEHRALESVIKGEQNDETRALTKSTDGTYLIPTSISEHIVKQVHHDSKLFSRTKQLEPVAGELMIPIENTIGTERVGFIGEWTNPGDPDVPGNMQTAKAGGIKFGDFTMSTITLKQKRVGSAIILSDKVVNESGIDVLGYAKDVLSRRLSQTVDYHILHGDPSSTMNNSLQGVVSTSLQNTLTANSQTEFTFDELRDVQFAINPELQKDCAWFMHSSTFAKLLKIKDDTGFPIILNNKLTDAPVYKILGAPIVFDDNMHEVEAGKTPILYGNFGEGYATMVKKDLHLQHVWQDRKRRSTRSHLLVLDQYLDGKIIQPEAFSKLTMKA